MDENKKADSGRLEDASAEPASTFSKGQHIRSNSCGPKMPQNRKNIQWRTYHSSSNIFSFLLLSFIPNVHSLPLQKITTYMSIFLEADNWMEAHYQALKLYMELDFLLLIPSHVPT